MNSRPPHETLHAKCPNARASDTILRLTRFADRRCSLTLKELHANLLQLASQFHQMRALGFELQKGGKDPHCCSYAAEVALQVISRLYADAEVRAFLHTPKWIDVKEVLMTAELAATEVFITSSGAPATMGSASEIQGERVAKIFRDLEFRWELASTDDDRRFIISIAADLAHHYPLAPEDVVRFSDLAIATFQARSSLTVPFSEPLAEAARRLVSMWIQLTDLPEGRSREDARNTVRYRCSWLCEILRGCRLKKHSPELLADWRLCLSMLTASADSMYQAAFAAAESQLDQWFAETDDDERPSLSSLRELRTTLVPTAKPRSDHTRVYPERIPWRLSDPSSKRRIDGYLVDVDAVTCQHVKIVWREAEGPIPQSEGITVWPSYPGDGQPRPIEAVRVRSCGQSEVSSGETGVVVKLDPQWASTSSWRKWIQVQPTRKTRS